MHIRNYTPADLDALRRLHAAQGFGYSFPDLESPLFITKLVLEEEEDSPPSSGMDFGLSRSSGRAEGAASSSQRAASSEATSREEVGREVVHRNSLAEKSYGEASLTAAHSHTTPRIVMAVLLRLTAEAYLLHDAHAGTPRQRWQNLLALHEAARQDAAARGLDDVQAFLPPQIARAFGRRLARLGWHPDPWPCFSRTTS